MNKLINIWRFIIFSNLLIAFAAASQSILTYYILQIPVNLPIVVFEWSATLLLYNLSMWLSMPKVIGDSPYLRTKWFFKNKLFFWILSFVSALMLGYSLLQIHMYSFALLILIGFLSLGYALPIIKLKGRMIALRQVVGIKLFLIAFVWSLSVVGMPVFEYLSTGAGELMWSKVILWASLVYLFILGVTLPFDIRDIKQDKHYNLQTIPVIIGQKHAQNLCYALIILHSILLVFVTVNFNIEIYGLILLDIIVLFILCGVVFKSNTNYERVYILDLILILQFIIVGIFHYFR